MCRSWSRQCIRNDLCWLRRTVLSASEDRPLLSRETLPPQSFSLRLGPALILKLSGPCIAYLALVVHRGSQSWRGKGGRCLLFESAPAVGKGGRRAPMLPATAFSEQKTARTVRNRLSSVRCSLVDVLVYKLLRLNSYKRFMPRYSSSAADLLQPVRARRLDLATLRPFRGLEGTSKRIAFRLGGRRIAVPGRRRRRRRRRLTSLIRSIFSG